MSPEEVKEIRSKLDTDNTGMVEYSNFTNIGSDIIFAYFMKNQVENKIRNKDEEFLIEAIMILYTHEIHENCQKIIARLLEDEE